MTLGRPSILCSSVPPTALFSAPRYWQWLIAFDWEHNLFLTPVDRDDEGILFQVIKTWVPENRRLQQPLLELVEGLLHLGRHLKFFIILQFTLL